MWSLHVLPALRGFPPGCAALSTNQRHASGLRLIGHSKWPIGVTMSVCGCLPLCQPSDELVTLHPELRATYPMKFLFLLRPYLPMGCSLSEWTV